MLVELSSIAKYKIPYLPGCYKILHFNGNHLIGLSSFDDQYFDIGEYYSYGVCDTPEQFMEIIGPILKASEDKFVVFFTHVPKVPGEKDGWRWHKWGEYIGTGTPQTEYIADEPEFDEGVYTYHCYRVNECGDNFIPDQQTQLILDTISQIRTNLNEIGD